MPNLFASITYCNVIGYGNFKNLVNLRHNDLYADTKFIYTLISSKLCAIITIRF